MLAVLLGHTPGEPCYQLIYSFHMPLYFIIAGYFFRSDKDFKSRIVKDSRRLLLPYIVCMAVLAIYTIVVHGLISKDRIQISAFFMLCLFPAGANGIGTTPLWFLPALFWCREVANAVYCFTGRWGNAILMTIGFSTVLVCDLLPCALPLAFLQGLEGLMFFAVGNVIRRYTGRLGVWTLLVAVVIWLVGCRYCAIDMATCCFSYLPVALATAVSGTLTVYVLSKATTKLTPPICALSLNISHGQEG